MPNLPSYEQQESIKRTVDEIAKKLPAAGSGGTDLFNMTPMITTATITSSTATNLVSVTGAGFLNGINAVSHSNTSVMLSIIIDGVTLMNEVQFNFGQGTISSLALMLPFKKSLVVKHRSLTNGSPIRTSASYLLK